MGEGTLKTLFFHSDSVLIIFPLLGLPHHQLLSPWFIKLQTFFKAPLQSFSNTPFHEGKWNMRTLAFSLAYPLAYCIAVNDLKTGLFHFGLHLSRFLQYLATQYSSALVSSWHFLPFFPWVFRFWWADFLVSICQALCLVVSVIKELKV